MKPTNIQIHFKLNGRYKTLSRESFLRYYEPDVNDPLNVKRDDGMWLWWRTKRSGKRIRISLYSPNV